MDSLARAVEAADGPWPVLAIAVIGLYVLAWKFGKDFLSILKANHAETKHISESIVTNHGSKNLGDAVDRLTEQVGLLRLEVHDVAQKTDSNSVRIKILEATRS
jgi:hypothetical protein